MVVLVASPLSSSPGLVLVARLPCSGGRAARGLQRDLDLEAAEAAAARRIDRQAPPLNTASSHNLQLTNLLSASHSRVI